MSERPWSAWVRLSYSSRWHRADVHMGCAWLVCRSGLFTVLDRHTMDYRWTPPDGQRCLHCWPINKPHPGIESDRDPNPEYERHEFEPQPHWSTKIGCSCGEEFANKMTFYLHRGDAYLAQLDGSAQQEGVT